MIEIKDGFRDEMLATLGEEQSIKLITALDTEPVTAVRFNPRKRLAETATYSEEADMLCGEPIEWCSEGRVLPLRPQFTLMPEWHAGYFYVQEPASMIIGEIVKRLLPKINRTNIRYLDICAAPGGKTTAALSTLPDDAFVVANEFVPTRANILVENLTKWGTPNVAVTCGDTAIFRQLPDFFDIVAVDAPCSGEGMMRKDEQARSQWSEALVEQCSAMQREILGNAWVTLRPGGFLIYSTCTFNRTENEEMLHFLINELGAENIDTGVNGDFNLPKSLDRDLSAVRFMPHLTLGEGLFMGVVRKPGNFLPQGGTTRNKCKGSRQNTSKIPDHLRNLISDPDKYSFSQNRDGVWRAIPASHAELVNSLEKYGRVLLAGVKIGEEKGKNFVPDAALALNNAMASAAFPRINVDKETALNYLRREALILPVDTPRGNVVIQYNGLPLGFVKNLGNRANNLYPQAWRIRHL